MTCVKGQIGNDWVCICLADIFKIRAGGQIFLFEYHKFCGPSLVDENGEILPGMIPEDSPFWDALTAWLKHGRKVDEAGFCITE